jgi:hypothetical protein
MGVIFWRMLGYGKRYISNSSGSCVEVLLEIVRLMTHKAQCLRSRKIGMKRYTFLDQYTHNNLDFRDL